MSNETLDIKKDATSSEVERLRNILNGETPIVENKEVSNEEEVQSKENVENTSSENLEENETKETKVEKDVEDSKVEGEEKKGELIVGVDEESVMAYLKSRNIQIGSIEELSQKITQSPKDEEVEDPNKIALRKLEIKKWAIENEKIDPKKIEQFEEDSKLSDIEIAYKLYYDERKDEVNPNTDEQYTDSELREEFEEENFLNEEDTSLLKKRRLKNISLVAQTYKYETYKDLVNLEKSFDNHVMTASEERILNETTNNAKSKIIENGMSFSIKDDVGVDVVVNIPITKKLLDEISLKGTEIENISDTDGIASIIQDVYFLKNKAKVLHEVATSYHSQKILGIKRTSIGIENKKAEMQEITSDEITEKYKKLVEKHRVN